MYTGITHTRRTHNWFTCKNESKTIFSTETDPAHDEIIVPHTGVKRPHLNKNIYSFNHQLLPNNYSNNFINLFVYIIVWVISEYVKMSWILKFRSSAVNLATHPPSCTQTGKEGIPLCICRWFYFIYVRYHLTKLIRMVAVVNNLRNDVVEMCCKCM